LRQRLEQDAIAARFGHGSGPQYPHSPGHRVPNSVVYEGDKNCLPLAGLIEHSTALSDLTYDYSDQFSPYLIQAIQASHHQIPACEPWRAQTRRT